MTRSLLVLTALLFSITFTASEAPVTRVVKASAVSQSELSVETIYTAPQQSEKHFLPADELTLTLIQSAFVAVALFAPALPAYYTDLNNRGPPTSLA